MRDLTYDPSDVAEFMASRGITSCILCRNEADTMGYWQPSQEALRAMGAEATSGGLIYGLCECCMARPGFNERVEAKIIAAEQAKGQTVIRRSRRRRHSPRLASSHRPEATVLSFSPPR